MVLGASPLFRSGFSRMNRAQRSVLKASLGLDAAMMIYPPFAFPGRFGGSSAGHHFFFLPPQGAHLDVLTLLYQFVILYVVVGVITLLLGPADNSR